VLLAVVQVVDMEGLAVVLVVFLDQTNHL